MALFLLGSQLRARLVASILFLLILIWYLGLPQPLDNPSKEYILPGNELDDIQIRPPAEPDVIGSPVQPGAVTAPAHPDVIGSPVQPAVVTTTPARPNASVAPTQPVAGVTSTPPNCKSFQALQMSKPGPKSEGKREFPYVRPPPECRTFKLPAMEKALEKMKSVVKDPDLFRLFENSYPNTLDTMVKWRGYANETDPETGNSTVTDEELTYVITGDIDAMWLRDSASQIYSYLPFLEASTDSDSLASLWRGLINAHSRYIIISPYCHSFQPPPESGIPPTKNGAYTQNHPYPPYDPIMVFDCKWELDSLASFLQISAAYYAKTGDLAFFAKYRWAEAVDAAVQAAAAMRTGTYDENGKVLPSAWTFTGWTNRGSETLTNDGLGNPVRENGMVRSAFRPSDDACIFQLLVPANMMFATYLEDASHIMEKLADSVEVAANVTVQMRRLASGIRAGIARDAIVRHRDFGDIFAYEVDGFGGANLMDDANVPSLLAMPLWNFTRKALVDAPAKYGAADPSEKDYATVYRNTRKFVLSSSNPYYSKGPVLSAVGGPHLGPGKGWPMAATVAALTAYEDITGLKENRKELETAVGEQLRMILDSTAGTGVVHESVDAWNARLWSRSWFGWANGLFGELIMRIARDEEHGAASGGDDGLLGRSWQ